MIIIFCVSQYSFFSIVECEWVPWEIKDYDYPGPRLDGSNKTSCHGIAGKCLGTGLSPSTAKGNRTRIEIRPTDLPVRACEGSSFEECDAPCPGKPFIIHIWIQAILMINHIITKYWIKRNILSRALCLNWVARLGIPQGCRGDNLWRRREEARHQK